MRIKSNTKLISVIILYVIGLLSFASVPYCQVMIPSTTTRGGRGLMNMQSARTFGKGRVVVGAKGLVMSKEMMIRGSDGREEKQMDLPAVLVLPLTFGLTDEIDLTASLYGLHDARGWENPADISAGYGDSETGPGATYVGLKVRLPFSHKSRIQIAGKFGAVLDTSVRQLEGMNYRWSREGTDIETSLLESFDVTSYMSLHLEQGYILSGTDWYDDQITGAAGLELRLAPWWQFNCELINRTFLGKSPESLRRADSDPEAYYKRGGVPAVGDPLYVIDTENDYDRDFFIVAPSMVFRLNKYMSFDVGAHINIADQVKPKETLQAVVGLTFATEIKAFIDSDGDGVPNNKDAEPGTPKGFSVDNRGRALDTDRDGVPDGADREADTPLGAHVNEYGIAVDSDGDGVFDGLDMEPNTPYGCPVDKFGVALDTDRDGVPDGLDAEADTPKGAVVDANGVAVDEDGDGVPNGLDMQPNTVKGAVVDSNGIALDTDGDGVPDGIDLEPNTPEGILVDRTGKALIKQEFSLLREGLIRLNTIYYEGGTSAFPKDAYHIIDEIGRIMRKYPALMIQIEGHTDSTGDPAINMKLARDRARIVLEEILTRFPDLDRDRFRVVGFGSDKPVASNKTFEGRRANRRVEFVIINQESTKP